MNLRRMLVLFVLGAIGLFVALSSKSTQPTTSAAPAKVDLCHVTGNGGLQPISVSSNATAPHLAHGDFVNQPNTPVPGNPGAVYDSRCNVVSWNYAFNVAPDFTAQDPSAPGTLYVGTGIPAENFGVARNESAGIELGLMVLYRQGPTVVSTDNYADGILNFNVASGPQSTANGSSGNNINRAAWNFTFSVATGLNSVPTNLSSHTFQLLYDVDPGPGTNYRTLTLEPKPSPGPGESGYQWRDSAFVVPFIADDEGNANVTQNSENYSFGFFQSFLTSPYGPGNSFAGPAQFDIILQALDGTQIIDRNHIRVNVQP